jgi:hypothetical protein
MELSSGALALFSEKSRSEAIVFPILEKRYYINDLPSLLGVLQTIVDIQLKSV